MLLYVVFKIPIELCNKIDQTILKISAATAKYCALEKFIFLNSVMFCKTELLARKSNNILNTFSQKFTFSNCNKLIFTKGNNI